METKIDIASCLQDYAALQGWLLLLMDALETGQMQKSFFMFNDSWNDSNIAAINNILADRYGIKVPESEL